MTNDKKSFWDDAWKKVAFFAALIASLFGILLFIYQSVNIITNNDKFLNKLASKINPYIIFDSNERYLKDGGAMEYLKDDIKVIKGLHPDYNDSLKAPVQIVIRTRKLLSFEPQINCLDGENEELIKVKRGKNTTWVFDLSGWLSNNPGGIDTFRVELIP
jgi:hypothetical protein